MAGFDDDQDFYQMSHGGRVLILHNENFYSSQTNKSVAEKILSDVRSSEVQDLVKSIFTDERRHGDLSDIDRIHSLLKSMRIDTKYVSEYRDKSASDMYRIFQNESSNRILNDVDYLLCFMMSHGSLGCIQGSDFKPVSLKHVFAQFTRDKCPLLKGKPKMFFIQACRGSSPEPDEVQSDVQSDSCAGTRPLEEFTVSVNSDMFVAYSSEEGTPSFRSRSVGSYFIQDICDVFEAHWQSKSLDAMMTKVNRLIAARVMNARCKQTSNYKSSLRRGVYFNPEILRHQSPLEQKLKTNSNAVENGHEKMEKTIQLLEKQKVSEDSDSTKQSHRPSVLQKIKQKIASSRQKPTEQEDDDDEENRFQRDVEYFVLF